MDSNEWKEVKNIFNSRNWHAIFLRPVFENCEVLFFLNDMHTLFLSNNATYYYASEMGMVLRVLFLMGDKQLK